MSFDARLTLKLDDRADARLEGLVAADTYGETGAFRVVAPAAAVRRAPDPTAEQLSQILHGEDVDVLDWTSDFAFTQARRDGYVGYVHRHALAPRGTAPTHRVSVLRTYGYSGPSIKTAPVGLYSLNALVIAGEPEGKLVDCGASGWIPARHLAPIGAFMTDPAAVAEQFLGAPYQWGGCESLGLDCSGLVQQALRACGRACPRDSDQQAAMGRPIADRADLARGDLVFWKGHVGLMLDGERLIHANAHHMAVAIEPLDGAIERIKAAGGGPPTALRRLSLF
jgi:NlpC/P60 family/Bacterial dipeptidyl-peptidase Sh3 domain